MLSITARTSVGVSVIVVIATLASVSEPFGLDVDIQHPNVAGVKHKAEYLLYLWSGYAYYTDVR